jgi:hypothetical protein
MGWSSGSEILEKIKEQVNETEMFSDEQLLTLWKIMIEAFEDHDCDTLYELVGEGDLNFDLAFKEINGLDSIGDEAEIE